MPRARSASIVSAAGAQPLRVEAVHVAAWRRRRRWRTDRRRCRSSSAPPRPSRRWRRWRRRRRGRRARARSRRPARRADARSATMPLVRDHHRSRLRAVDRGAGVVGVEAGLGGAAGRHRRHPNTWVSWMSAEPGAVRLSCFRAFVASQNVGDVMPVPFLPRRLPGWINNVVSGFRAALERL